MPLPTHKIKIERVRNNSSVIERASETYDVILEANRRVTMAETPKEPYDNPEQANSAAQYILYMLCCDPVILENDRVTIYNFRGLTKKARVKKIVPYTLTIQNVNCELWCDSSNN